MILQDIMNIISCGIFVIQPWLPYHSYARNSIRTYGLTFFAADAIFFNSELQYFIHHIIASSILLVDTVIPYEDLEIYYLFCNTEWSTLVLTGMAYVTNPLCKKFCELLFVSLFFKFRMYDCYYLFQANNMDFIHTLPLVALYTLNLYWWVLICKKICKPLKYGIYHVLNHHIVSYPMLINWVILCGRTYPNNCYLQFISFISGIAIYLYHKEIAILYHGIPTIESAWIILDVTAFHLFQIEYVRLAYHEIFYLSLPIHVFNLLYIYIINPRHISNYSMIALALDNVYVLYYYPSIELYTIVMLLGYIHVLNPVYDLSFVATHGVLAWYIFHATTNILKV